MALDDPQLLRVPAFEPPARSPGLRRMLRGVRTVVDGWPASVFEGTVHRGLPWAPLVVSEPDIAHEVLVTRADEFPHGELFNRLFRPVWGRGLFVVEGADWRWQRHAAAPAFRPARMHALAPIMRAGAEAALARWQPGEPIDLHAEMRTLTLDVLFAAVLSGGQDFPDRADASRRIRAFLDGVGEFGLRDVLPLPDGWRGSNAARGGEHREYLRERVGVMLARRRALAEQPDDLVTMLMTAEDPETGQRMDDALVRDNLLGFLAAGTDTSSNALAWALWLVAHHPTVEARLVDEVAAVTGGEPVVPKHVSRLVYARQVIQETQRLFPGALAQVRSPTHDTTLAGHRVPRGTLVQIATYALHHRPDLWPDAARFDPDRWAEGRPKPPAGAYLPFGLGPRICMGASFALTEMTVVLATLVRERRFAADLGRPLRLGVRLGAPVAAEGMWMCTEVRAAPAT